MLERLFEAASVIYHVPNPVWAQKEYVDFVGCFYANPSGLKLLILKLLLHKMRTPKDEAMKYRSRMRDTSLMEFGL